MSRCLESERDGNECLGFLLHVRLLVCVREKYIVDSLLFRSP